MFVKMSFANPSKESFLTSSMNGFSMQDSKHGKLKKLIKVIQEYLKSRAEDNAQVICRILQALSITIDVSVFDPHTNVAAEFFVSLYELMNHLDQNSSIIWYCVDVLSNACKNRTARKELIKTYNFIPSLSRLLGDHLSVEKKIRLLRLMQDLSCGVKISWQIPHLPHLLKTLAKWVENQIEEIVTLSLGVLVNLCYKNLPAIYTLTSNIDVKRFCRICTPLKGPIVEVHVCKLMIILDNMKDDAILEPTFLKLIEATFESIIEAFSAKDSMLMRQIVELFKDVQKPPRETLIIRNYHNYHKKIEHLLEVIENNQTRPTDRLGDDQDPECISLIIEFFLTLLEQKNESIMEFNGRFLQLALKWIQNDIVSANALDLLKVIAINIDRSENAILEPLITGLPVFLINLNSGDSSIPTHTEYCKQMGSLMQLLQAMLLVDRIRPALLSELKEEMLARIFTPLIGDRSPRERANAADTYSTEAVNLYVYTVSLLNELVKYDGSWIMLQENLMQNPQLHMIFAQALFGSPPEVKKLVLRMAISPSFNSGSIANAMDSLQATILMGSISSKSSPEVKDLNFPVLSVAQVERVDETIAKLNRLLSENNTFNISTSDVMELYEFKVASMGHAERAAMLSIEAASEKCTHLQHRNAQLTAELNRLHQLLFHAQHCQEQALKSKESFVQLNVELEKKAESEREKLKMYLSKVSAQEKALSEAKAKLEELNQKLEEKTREAKLSEEQNIKYKHVITKIEENCTRLEKNIQKKEEMLKKANSTIEALRSQVEDLEVRIKEKQKEIEKRELELDETVKELKAKKQVLDTITKFASGQ